MQKIWIFLIMIMFTVPKDLLITTSVTSKSQSMSCFMGNAGTKFIPSEVWSQCTDCRNSEGQIVISACVSVFCNPSEVELFAKKNPKQMLRRLEVFLNERRAGVIPRGASPDPQAQQPSPSLGERVARIGTGQGSKGKEMHFTGVCDLPPDMEGEARLI